MISIFACSLADCLHCCQNSLSGSWNDMSQESSLMSETDTEYLNRKLNFLWLAEHLLCTLLHTGSCKCHSLLTAHCLKHLLGLRATHVKEFVSKMAQGKEQSFASRLFQKYCKGSQEQRGQESDVPHISEFTLTWDKSSKCTLILHLQNEH